MHHGRLGRRSFKVTCKNFGQFINCLILDFFFLRESKNQIYQKFDRYIYLHTLQFR